MLTPATCAARIKVLIQLSRPVDEPVPTAADLARVVSIRTSQIVAPDTIEDALVGRRLLDEAALTALAEAYHAPTALFTDTAEGEEIENRLRACLAIRDRFSDDGVNVIARGSRFTTRQVSDVLEFLQRG